MSPQSIHVLVPRTCDLFHRKRDTIKSRTRGGQYLPLGYLGLQCHHKGPSKGEVGGSKQEGGSRWREAFQDGGGEGPGAKGCRQLLEAEERNRRNTWSLQKKHLDFRLTKTLPDVQGCEGIRVPVVICSGCKGPPLRSPLHGDNQRPCPTSHLGLLGLLG